MIGKRRNKLMFALVTGAAGGIGEEIVHNLAADGYTVILHYRNNFKNAEALRMRYGEKIILAPCDFSDLEKTALWADGITNAYKNIGVLVNNAGIGCQSLLTETADSDIINVINVNLTAAMLISKRVAKVMTDNKYGRIVNISSVFGCYGGSCETAYSAAKGGLIAFTKALSKELGLSNITVNCVAPGLIDTAMNDNLSTGDKDDFCRQTALNRMGNAKDVADAVSFFLSDKASFITGQVLGADGGY